MTLDCPRCNEPLDPLGGDRFTCWTSDCRNCQQVLSPQQLEAQVDTLNEMAGMRAEARRLSSGPSVVRSLRDAGR